MTIIAKLVELFLYVEIVLPIMLFVIFIVGALTFSLFSSIFDVLKKPFQKKNNNKKISK